MQNSVLKILRLVNQKRSLLENLKRTLDDYAMCYFSKIWGNKASQSQILQMKTYHHSSY